MNFIERLPALVEPMAGVPETWRARLEDGTPVAVRHYAQPEPEQLGSAMTRLRSLAALRNPHVIAPLGAAADADGLSVLYPADLATGLDRALRRPLEAATGLALAEDVLGALGTMHEAGLVHGAVGEHAVRINRRGVAGLWAADPWAAAGPAARTEDVRAAAQMLCRALGVPLEWAPNDPLREAERAAPALVATLRALSRGSLAMDAAGALGAVREAAGGLGEEGSSASARATLAALAGATPPSRAQGPTIPPHAGSPLAPLERGRGRRLPILIGAAAAVLILGVIGVIGWRTSSPRPSSTTNLATSHSPEASPSPSAPPSPSPLPASSGDVKSVVETPLNSCATGSACTIEVEVQIVHAPAPEQVSWQFELVDSCTGDASYVNGNNIQALTGWTHVIGDTRVSLPAGHSLSVVAVTQQPSQAASSPILVAGGSC